MSTLTLLDETRATTRVALRDANAYVRPNFAVA